MQDMFGSVRYESENTFFSSSVNRFQSFTYSLIAKGTKHHNIDCSRKMNSALCFNSGVLYPVDILYIILISISMDLNARGKCIDGVEISNYSKSPE